jgi:membrane-associated phospholipid phosphatase
MSVFQAVFRRTSQGIVAVPVEQLSTQEKQAWQGRSLFLSRSTNSPRSASPQQATSRRSPSTLRRSPTVQIALTVASDSGLLGDLTTTNERVNVTGKTTANARVTLKGQRQVADRYGRFQFDDVALTLGRNSLQIETRTADGRSLFQSVVRRVATENFDPVTNWNAIAVRTVLTEQTAAPIAARNLAIAQSAVFDAVNNVTLNGGTPRYRSYRIRQPSPNSSAEAAAIAAASTVLSELYPNQRTAIGLERDRTLATIADSDAKANGIRLGDGIGNNAVSDRANDGVTQVVNDTSDVPGTQAGQWRPNPPAFKSASLPGYGTVRPFVLTRGSQFRPPAPPALTSRQYATELNQVKRLGAVDSRDRTPDQTEIAQFWAVSSPAHWNQITAQLVAKKPQPLVETARTYALLNLALVDAGIAAWDAKYTYNTWRPVTAIQVDGDGNGQTRRSLTWTPLFETPNHPDYVSAHSTFSGAASTVLTRIFGNNTSFITGSVGLPGKRSYRSFSQAAVEVGNSRIYGGIHTNSANQAGLQTGQQVGQYILQTTLQ